jgi:hypothetical protein
MARALIWLVRECAEYGKLWADIQAEAPRHLMISKEHGQLVHWDLARQNPDVGGLWAPTDLGVEFAHNRLTVPRYVYLYRNQIESISDAQTSIIEALGRRFDYDALMRGEG